MNLSLIILPYFTGLMPRCFFWRMVRGSKWGKGANPNIKMKKSRWLKREVGINPGTYSRYHTTTQHQLPWPGIVKLSYRPLAILKETLLIQPDLYSEADTACSETKQRVENGTMSIIQPCFDTHIHTLYEIYTQLVTLHSAYNMIHSLKANLAVFNLNTTAKHILMCFRGHLIYFTFNSK